uniref:Uncharacterized protein n=1 Tax=Oryza punctata TaxID=4537 RepID=A0A0E0LR78_ORYPU
MLSRLSRGTHLSVVHGSVKTHTKLCSGFLVPLLLGPPPRAGRAPAGCSRRSAARRRGEVDGSGTGARALDWEIRMSNKRMKPTVLEASTYDFISSLPDESLQHILSFMTTREAIQTCVLSTRWHHIWKSVQCLNIEASEFTSKMGFVNFMDNLPSHTLYQHGSVSLNHHNANVWVGYALRSNVRELHIREHYSEYFDLDHSSFISSHLKILRLRNVSISDLFIEKLFSGCPALQDLVMIDCCVYATRFSSTSLKNLTFISHSPDNGDFVHDDYKDLVIDTPSLVSLHLEYLPFLAPCLVNVSSVAKAYICLDDMSFPCFDTKYNILSALSNVTKLKLLNEDSDDEDDSFRLRQNEIGGLAWEQWMSYPQSEMPDMLFICERLKKVKITCADDDKRVPAIVNAILANANSLPEIVIKPYTATVHHVFECMSLRPGWFFAPKDENVQQVYQTNSTRGL